MLILQKYVRNKYFFSSQKYQSYQYPYTYNLQNEQNYLKKINKLSTENTINTSTLLPRRKRRIYDKPKHDLDISNYTAWRLYKPRDYFRKDNQHCTPVIMKILLSPKWLIHCFGQKCLTLDQKRSSDGQFMFQDNQLSHFLLYQYRCTTNYKANLENFPYDNQQHLQPSMKKKKRISSEQFWNSQSQFEFRVNASSYAHHLKFKKWIKQMIEKKKTQQSYDQFINQKFGHVYTFNHKQEINNFIPNQPYILNATKKHFQQPNNGQQLSKPNLILPKKLESKYQIQVKKQILQSVNKVYQ